MRRWLIGLIVLGILVAAAIGLGWRLVGRIEPPIRVGLLHSRTGPMAISEDSMIEAELLALKEINDAGGLLGGRLVEGVVADGRSDWPTFAREAQRLIDQEKVSVIIGCWTSASRKSVKPIVEQKNHLLIYPMAYEGLEESPNIVYTGAAPNQQVIPAVSWCFETLKARKFFLVGSDYVWPHCVNEIIKDQFKALGAECVGESYILFGSAAVEDAVAAIAKAAPDVIVSTVVGDTNEPFYRRLQASGIRPERTPVVSFSIAEDELRKLPVQAMVGDYAAWDYFQSIDRPENRAFIQRFKAAYGAERVTSDVIEAAYNSVHLWAQAVTEAESDVVTEVVKVIGRQSLNAPEGIVSVDEDTQHIWRPVSIGRVRADGQFDLVWNSEKAVRPIPFPPSRTRSEWETLLEGLNRAWGGWANPGGKGPVPLPVAPPAAARSPRGRGIERFALGLRTRPGWERNAPSSALRAPSPRRGEGDGGPWPSAQSVAAGPGDRPRPDGERVGVRADRVPNPGANRSRKVPRLGDRSGRKREPVVPPNPMVIDEISRFSPPQPFRCDRT